MIITENGFYKLSDILKQNKIDIQNITINDNLIVTVFDDLNGYTQEPLGGIYNIYLGENSKMEYYGLLENVTYEINFIQDKENSNLIVRYLLLSKNSKNVKAKIYSTIGASNTKTDLHITSIIGNQGFVDLDGIIKINQSVDNSNAKLLEENLFLGNTGKVKGIPTLLVRSNDVKASHACKMEKISNEKLFYLRSRGIGKENAIFMMIESYIFSIFKCVSMFDELFYKDLFENIIKKVK